MPEELYPTSYVAERTIARMHEFAARPDQPFFLKCSFPDPHHPFTPPGKYWDIYRAADMPLPASWHVEPDSVPPHVRHLFAERDNGTARKDTPALFACTEHETRAADRAHLRHDRDDRRRGRAHPAGARRQRPGADTITIFTSDHGDLMGDHQLMLKGPVHYQGLIRVPFIWRETAERRVTGRRSGLASTIDMPTHHPRSRRRGTVQRHARRVSQLHGDHATPRHAAMPCSSRRRASACTWASTAASACARLSPSMHRLSLYEGADWAELYDRQADPLEMHNRWDDPAAQDTARRMIERSCAK